MFQTLQIRNNQSIIIKLILIIIIIVIKTIIKSGKGIYIHTYRILSLCMRILIYKSKIFFKKISKKFKLNNKIIKKILLLKNQNGTLNDIYLLF